MPVSNATPAYQLLSRVLRTASNPSRARFAAIVSYSDAERTIDAVTTSVKSAMMPVIKMKSATVVSRSPWEGRNTLFDLLLRIGRIACTDESGCGVIGDN